MNNTVSRPITRLAAGLLLASMLASGCGQIAPSQPSAPTSAAAPKSEATSPAATAAQTRTITDVAGRTVQIPAVVNRVANAWPANVGMVLMLGGADKLVGITQQAQNQPWLRKLYPRVTSIPIISSGQSDSDINIETLVSTHPDVLLVSLAGGMPTWLDKVEEPRSPSF